MTITFQTTRRVEFCETDMAGIVHFSQFALWMEQAEHEFLRSRGLSVVDYQADGSKISWPRLMCACEFHAPVRFEDEVTVKLELTRVGEKSLTYESSFLVNESHVASGMMKTVCCCVMPGEPLQSIPIPLEFRAGLEAGHAG